MMNKISIPADAGIDRRPCPVPKSITEILVDFNNRRFYADNKDEFDNAIKQLHKTRRAMREGQ